MIIECCSQERSYSTFYGLVGERFSKLNRVWTDSFEIAFGNYYTTVHRYETNRLRNIARFFGHLLATDSISWAVFECVKINEDDTTSSSRIFVKILMNEMMESMGLKVLAERFKDPEVKRGCEGMFPVDVPKNTRFAINYFTSIGLGVITGEMREYLTVRLNFCLLSLPLICSLNVTSQNAPRLIMEQRRAMLEASSSSSDSDSSDTDSDSDSSSDTSSDSSDSDSDSTGSRRSLRRKRRTPTPPPRRRIRDDSQSPPPRRGRDDSRSPPPQRGRDDSRSPPPRRGRGESRSPPPLARRGHDNLRSPLPPGRRGREESRSRSPPPPSRFKNMDRNRDRIPDISSRRDSPPHRRRANGNERGVSPDRRERRVPRSPPPRSPPPRSRYIAKSRSRSPLGREGRRSRSRSPLPYKGRDVRDDRKRGDSRERGAGYRDRERARSPPRRNDRDRDRRRDSRERDRGYERRR